jgi:hypothetical protein
MGNSVHRYLSHSEAAEVLGYERWTSLKNRFDKHDTKFIDYGIFSTIIISKFEKMVSGLILSLDHLFILLTIFCYSSGIIIAAQHPM